jgi:hypothetical protein
MLEMTITTLVIAVALAAMLGAVDRATKQATFSQRRNEALDDLRTMAAIFSKDVRQGITATEVAPNEFTFDTYVGSEEHAVSWLAQTSAGGDRLVRSVDGAVEATYVVDLTTTAVFSYFGETDPAQVNRVRLSLATATDERFGPVGLSTEVEMRNVG